MGRIERILGALAAFLTIATGAFLIYDRFRSENAAQLAESEKAAATPAGSAAPAAPALDATAKTATPASSDQTTASDAAEKKNSAIDAAPAKPRVQLVFLCDGQRSVTAAGRNPSLENLKNAPPEAEAIFDFSNSKQSGLGEVLLRGQGSEWGAYPVAIQMAGQRSQYSATGKNAQGLTFAERGEVNLETLEWTSTRIIRSGAQQRGPQAEVKIAGKCSALDSPKPKPSDAPPQWQIEAK